MQSVIERTPQAFIAPRSAPDTTAGASAVANNARCAAASSDPLLSVQSLLDILEVYYWHTPSSSSFARQPLFHMVTGEVIGERPKAEGLRRLRTRLLRLLNAVTEAHLSRADAQCLVVVLRSCRDARVLIDVVKLLMGWLAPIGDGHTSPPASPPRLSLAFRPRPHALALTSRPRSHCCRRPRLDQPLRHGPGGEAHGTVEDGRGDNVTPTRLP